MRPSCCHDHVANVLQSLATRTTTTQNHIAHSEKEGKVRSGSSAHHTERRARFTLKNRMRQAQRENRFSRLLRDAGSKRTYIKHDAVAAERH